MGISEEEIKKVAEHYLIRCRPGDWYHALNVVKWVKILGKGRADLKLLISAAYIHDIGWFELTSDKLLSFDDEMLKLEPKANKNTEKRVRLALEELKFEEKDVKTIIRLIGAADKHHSENGDEAILVDADSLSKLDAEHLIRKFKKTEIPHILAKLEKEMPDWISTKKAKELYPKMMKDLKKEINSI